MVLQDAPRRRPRRDRRAGPETGLLRRSWLRLRGFLSRPIGLEGQGWQWHLVWVERRRAAAPATAPSVSDLRHELRERLVIEGEAYARAYLRHLMVVHRQLGKLGWPGVGVLPVAVLEKALAQLELLLARDPSSALDYLLERLRQFRVAAERREANRRLLAHGDAGAIEVSEASAEDFEQTERSWFATLPGPAEPREGER
ncbi:MAG: hypothetical protein U1F50_01175 [Rubrivivax sp.]